LTAPANKLSKQERQQILDISNSAPFRDLSPKQIVPKLADQGVYLASESTFYRVLKEHEMLAQTRSNPSKRTFGHGAMPGMELGHHVSADFCQGPLFLPLHGCRCLES